ncbi:MFS transporter, partial [Lactobacillus nasalidis]
MESTARKTAAEADASSLMFKTAILSSTLLLTGVGLGSVFLPSLKASYPGISDVMLKSFVSLPNAAQLLALVLVGMLTAKFGKKKLLLFGSLLFVISGIAPLFVTSFGVILLARLFLGFSVGLVQPIGTSLLADYYQERNKLMGFQSAFSGLANTLMTFIVGLFIQTSWRMGFSVYLIGLIIFFLTWIYLPKDQKQAAPAASQQPRAKTKLSLNVIWWMLAMFLFNMAYSSGILEFSLTVVETHSGSATDAANVTAAVAVISLVAGLIFGKYMQLTKKYA